MKNTNYSKRLENCYTGVVNDVMREMAIKNYILPSHFRSTLQDKVLAGPVFTITGQPSPDTNGHQTLLEWTGLLSKSKSGHIWVSQPNDSKVAHMGELSAETLQSKGVKGAVVDGLIRDVGFIRNLEFQVWSKGHTPADVVGYWLPTGFDVAIIIGSTTIYPGDYLLADQDGIIIIPSQIISQVLDKSEEAIQKENQVRGAILDGVDPQEAYIKYGKF
jgi:4-hydroxy-4-methyl-2-oxoglutarate aldolase